MQSALDVLPVFWVVALVSQAVHSDCPSVVWNVARGHFSHPKLVALVPGRQTFSRFSVASVTMPDRMIRSVMLDASPLMFPALPQLTMHKMVSCVSQRRREQKPFPTLTMVVEAKNSSVHPNE